MKLLNILLLFIFATTGSFAESIKNYNKCFSVSEIVLGLSTFRSDTILYSGYENVSMAEEKNLFFLMKNCSISARLYKELFSTLLGHDDHNFRVSISKKHIDGIIDGNFYMEMASILNGNWSIDKEKYEIVEAAVLQMNKIINGKTYLSLLKHMNNFNHNDRVRASTIR